MFYYGGALSVSLFLFLSGYLAIKRTNLNKTDFYELLEISFNISIKRLKAIYPLHIFTLLLSIPFCYKSLFLFFSLKQWLKLFLNVFLINSFFPSCSIFNYVSWYLPVFIFISFMSPFLTSYFKRIKNKTDFELPLLIFTTIWFIQFVWTWFWKDYTIGHWIIYACPFVRLLDFILGINVFLFEEYKNRKLLYEGLIISLIILYISLEIKSVFFLVTTWSLPATLIILGLTNSRLDHFASLIFCNRIIVKLGDISFELFMFHQLIIRYLSFFSNKFFPIYKNSLFIYLLAFILSVIMSLLWKRYFVNRKIIGLTHI